MTCEEKKNSRGDWRSEDDDLFASEVAEQNQTQRYQDQVITFLAGQLDSEGTLAEHLESSHVPRRFLWRHRAVRSKEDLLAMDKVNRTSASTLLCVRVQNKSRAAALTESH